MIATHRFAVLLTAVTLIATLGGCDRKSDKSLFVDAGDPFFDDAASRLSPAEKKRLGVERADQLQGFFFQGQREACIVLLPRKSNVILHGPDAAFCYDTKTNMFTKRI